MRSYHIPGSQFGDLLRKILFPRSEELILME